jgi:hypothetical protein
MSDDFATALLKDAEKKKAPRLEQQLSRYVKKLNHLTPTSNKCERLFSLTKILLLSDRRKRVSSPVFLHANKDLWNEFTIDDIKDESKAACILSSRPRSSSCG